MRPGTKPKPIALRKVMGNPGKRALPTAEAQFIPSLPSPPPHLSDDAKVEWGRASDELYKVGLLTSADRSVFGAYCQAYGRWAQSERTIIEMGKKDLLTGGLMIKTSNGNAIQNPLVGIANKAMADMVRYATELGMTPSARSRITAAPPISKEDDPTAEYLN
jgi:P27 family predicted phage terminase small subunit